MKTEKDYHDFYFKCYFLLLGDVFEKFRNKSFKNYVLSPSLTWAHQVKVGM